MKSQTVLSWTSILCLFFLCACRADDEFKLPANAAVPLPESSSSFVGETKDPPKDPPKDVPKDYDNWRLK